MAEGRKPRQRAEKDLFGLKLKGRVAAASVGKTQKAGKGLTARIHFASAKSKRETVLAQWKGDVPDWQIAKAKVHPDPVQVLTSETGPLVLAHAPRTASAGHGGLVDDSPYGMARDLVGLSYLKLWEWNPGAVELTFSDAEDEEKLGAMVGLEIAGYRYLQVRKPSFAPDLRIPEVDQKLRDQAAALGTAVNVARHLVNTPSEDLNPTSYAQAVKNMFSGSTTMKVDVLAGKRLEKERCGLLMAVGRGAAEPPCLIHLKYRPSGAKGKKPVAFVGKGVTFDSGGLDIKPSSGMRLMKKDMGGSAALVGLAHWLETTGFAWPADIYLAVAENAVDSASFRPGDVLTSRKGDTIEIHNTDAEGRLVLADAIDYAVTRGGADKPAALIDVATLTGAMRIGLGLKFGGLFATHDGLADSLLAAGVKRGDPCWRMPLVAEYNEFLWSQFADCANASSSRFGGAITAALFLKRFVQDVPWAHLDVMAWAEKPRAAWAEPGGSGQVVQALAAFMQDLSPSVLKE